MRELKEVSWGVIGVGDVCEKKSAPAMNLIKDSKLVAVMRRNAEKAKDFARRHNVGKWYSDANQLIQDPEVNAIYIATPPDSHAMYTRMAAEAGKAVYVEKPMAKTYAECLAMIQACKLWDVPLFTAYYRRQLPNFLKIKSLLSEGVIGDIRYVNILLNKTLHPDILGSNGSKSNWRILPEISGGGYFFDLACHQLDILDFLFGPIQDAKGYAFNQANQYTAEDIVTGSFYFNNKIIGQGNWCFTTSGISDKELTTIVGSKGQISFPFFGDHSVTLELEGLKAQVFQFDIPKHIQQPHIQSIVDDLLGRGCCLSTGETAARTNKVMELICSDNCSGHLEMSGMLI